MYAAHAESLELRILDALTAVYPKPLNGAQLAKLCGHFKLKSKVCCLCVPVVTVAEWPRYPAFGCSNCAVPTSCTPGAWYHKSLRPAALQVSAKTIT